MGRVCTICSHTQRYEIEELLATRQSTYRGIARKYGVSEDAVSRHVKAGHVSQLLALAADAEREIVVEGPRRQDGPDPVHELDPAQGDHDLPIVASRAACLTMTDVFA